MEISYLALNTAFSLFEVVAVLRMTGFYFVWHLDVQRLERWILNVIELLPKFLQIPAAPPSLILQNCV